MLLGNADLTRTSDRGSSGKILIKATLSGIVTNKQLTQRRAQRVQHRKLLTTQGYVAEFKFITNQCSKVNFYRSLNYYSSSEFVIQRKSKSMITSEIGDATLKPICDITQQEGYQHVLREQPTQLTNPEAVYV